jgi:hypothetical protein
MASQRYQQPNRQRYIELMRIVLNCRCCEKEKKDSPPESEDRQIWPKITNVGECPPGPGPGVNISDSE